MTHCATTSAYIIEYEHDNHAQPTPLHKRLRHLGMNGRQWKTENRISMNDNRGILAHGLACSFARPMRALKPFGYVRNSRAHIEHVTTHSYFRRVAVCALCTTTDMATGLVRPVRTPLQALQHSNGLGELSAENERRRGLYLMFSLRL
jgi:hypothetical protein